MNTTPGLAAVAAVMATYAGVPVLATASVAEAPGTGSAAALGTVNGGTADAMRGRCGNPYTPGSFPNAFGVDEGTLFFFADDSTRGNELWKSDGTVAGTVMIRDITSGTDNGYGGYRGPMLGVDGLMFFAVDDGTHGRELWKTDGTKAGTAMVKDIAPGKRGGPVDSLTDADNTLFFVTHDRSHGDELWKSDGTKAGTVMVKDIHPEEVYDVGYPDWLTSTTNGTLFFTADDGTNGRELWKTDGTNGGTVMVEDPVPGERSGYPTWLTALGDEVFFSATDDAHGRELWKTDGTEAGTVMVKDIQTAGNSSAYVAGLVTVGDSVFFVAEDSTGPALWKSDGTEAGTVLVKDILPGPFPNNPYSMTEVGGMLYFTADDGIHGPELWTSDGTEAGTVMVKDIHPNAGGFDQLDPGNFTDVDGTLYFTADDGIHGPELWTSDGTEAGTVMVKDIYPANNYKPVPYPLAGVDGTVFFGADDGIHGPELWTSDGTEAGTVMVKDIGLGGRFAVDAGGKPNLRTGTMKVKVTVDATGQVVAAPVANSPLKRVVVHSNTGRNLNVLLTPTKAGMKELKRTGKVRVKTRFAYTTCAGTGSSAVRTYTLRMQQ